ncbi:MAG: hypothetical protein U0V56_08755 [Actinomycetota bacterium]
MFGRLFTGWGTPTELVTPLVVAAIALMLATQLWPPAFARHLRERVATLRPVTLGVVGAVGLFVITTLGPQGVAPFIYFQF